ncbi:MAG: carboxypeptidase regulatory-like domain-containing protein [Verrucomicrobia bacterium]|nr:carboxypeptidase regulatory-like domain-containing protein [Verrucomicrobiota bacterium]
MAPENRSSLAAPLWLVGLGLVVIGGGIFYLAHVLSEKRREAEARKAEAVVAALKTNQPPTTGTQPVRPGWSKVASRTNAARPPESAPVAPPDEPPAIPPAATNVAPSAKKLDFFGLAGNSSKSGDISSTPGTIIQGVVKLKGQPPPEKPLPLDPNCARLHIANPPTTQFYVVNGDRLADVVVFISAGLEGRTFQIPREPVSINQSGCIYEPYITAAFVGQRILVRNSDPLLHTVHPTPTVKGNRESNRVQPPKRPDLEFVFPQPEMFLRFKCDVHPWMFCYVSTFEHPFFAVTDEHGAFAIPEPPPGKYVVEAVHRKAGSQKKEIEVRASGGVKIDFEFAPR